MFTGNISPQGHKWATDVKRNPNSQGALGSRFDALVNEGENFRGYSLIIKIGTSNFLNIRIRICPPQNKLYYKSSLCIESNNISTLY